MSALVLTLGPQQVSHRKGLNLKANNVNLLFAHERKKKRKIIFFTSLLAEESISHCQPAAHHGA